MMTLKLTTVGESVGVILPRELLDRLGVKSGDELHVLETPKGIELTAHHPEFDKQMDLAEQVMAEDRDVLKKLSK